MVKQYTEVDRNKTQINSSFTNIYVLFVNNDHK